MIVLETYCGLCNRLRAIQATLDLAEKYGQKVLVFWDKNENCGCEYTDLFEKPTEFVVYTTEFTNTFSKVVRELWRRWARFSGAYLTQDKMDAENLWDERLEKKYRRQLKKKTDCLYIATWDNFFHSKKAPYGWLHLRPELTGEIERYREMLGAHAVGLHIRRTDHIDAIRESPTELFENAMRAELAKNPDVKFYVATDTASEREHLKALFPGKIVEKQSENLQRETVGGMHDTVLDVYCLAVCETIYGSFRSSFSEEAARLGGGKLITLRK